VPQETYYALTAGAVDKR